jgi:large subunit ribosomal protein L3e
MRGRIKTFPKDDPNSPVHFTAFLGYKAGMTHIVRDLDRPGSKMHKKEVCEAVTIIETPPMICVGMVGYIGTPMGLRALKTVWAHRLSDECKRRFYLHWARSKVNSHRAFVHYAKTKWAADGQAAPTPSETLQAEIDNIKKYATIVRAICHTQVSLVRLGPKRAHIAEIQINGGTIAEKVDFCLKHFEQQVRVSDVFRSNEIIDTISVNKGHGFEGVTHRWGPTRLPRKTHKGLRKVACIGSWHPARLHYTVPRAGQDGCHHRTEINKKIYQIGLKDQKFDMTQPWADYTQKPITPMGGFVWYGPVTNDYLMIKGSVGGPRKRVISMRKAIAPLVKKWMSEEIHLKFIDTSSKLGHGRFQTSEEKNKWMGLRKEKPIAQFVK